MIFRNVNIKDSIEFVTAMLYGSILGIIGSRHLCTVIYYHSITSEDVAGFDMQMKYLAQNCVVVRPSQIKNALPRNGKSCVAITIDDAFENIIHNALDVLKRYDIPAGIFVPVANLGDTPKWQFKQDSPDQYEKVMTADQVAQLADEGFEILSHTLSHPMLTQLEDEMLSHELQTSRSVLEDITGQPVIGMSYPHGDYDDRVCQAVKDADYAIAFTVEPETVTHTTDNFRIGRFNVSPRDSLRKFKLKISGAYQITKIFRKTGKKRN